MPPERRRGPYKKHLHDLSIPINKTSAWRRRFIPPLEEVQLNNEAENVMDNNIQQIEPKQIVQEHNPDSNPHINEDPLIPASPNSLADVDESDTEHSSVMFQSSNNASDNEDVSSCADSDEGAGRLSFADSDEDDDMHSSRSSSSNSSAFSEPEQGETEEEHVPFLRFRVEDPPQEDRERHLLYQGCRLTQAESDVLIMSFIIRWGLEEKSIEHLLQLINCHMPCSALGSQYLFLKKFPVQKDINIHYTCSNCLELLPENFEETECKWCGLVNERSSLKESGNYFVQLSVLEQLKEILCNESVRSLLRTECEERDVVTGNFYKSLKRSGVIGGNDVTIQWNTDSVSPFKSTKLQVWPIQACINELPYHSRRENMILCGLYFGKSKPNINAFLRPFVDELQSLHSTGFQLRLPGEEIYTTIKIHTLLASVDSVARPVLQGIMQYNGEYGCSFCLHPGVEIERGRGRARIYSGAKGPSRTIPQHMRALERLKEYNMRNRRKKNHIEGVKCQSVLLLLSVFNIIFSFVPEYLHSVLEGVVSSFLKHWCDATYREDGWFLNKRKRTILSERLKSILPPVEITRPPRGLGDLNLLKASELRNFLLYYSLPCLKGLLPGKYLRHWFLLVYSMTVYLREKFTPNEALTAKLALVKFVNTIETIYPNCRHLYTFNVHLLLHIPQSVKLFGGLWASSTLPYEHFNGIVARLLSGTRSRPEQVCRSFLRLRQISHLGSNVFIRPNCSAEGKKLFDLLMCKYRSSQFSQVYADDLRLFGSPEHYVLTLVEKVAVEECLNAGLINQACQSFRRVIFKGTVYHANAYKALKVRDNSTVNMSNGVILILNRILVVQKSCNGETFCVLLGEVIDLTEEIICQDLELNLSSIEVMFLGHKSGRIVCRMTDEMSGKCICIPYGNGDVCVVPLVNTFERD